MWDITGTAEGECINTTAFFYSTSAFNIVTDIWILVLPLKTLRSINRPTREKYALFLIFGVGTFAAVASIVRLHTIYTYTLAEDPFRDGILVNQWSVIEVTIAISCASVSALKPVFSSKQRRMTRRAVLNSSSGGGGTTGYGYGQSGAWRNTTQGDMDTGGEGGLQSRNEHRKSWKEQNQQPWHVKLMTSRDYYPAGREEEKSRPVHEPTAHLDIPSSAESSDTDSVSSMGEQDQEQANSMMMMGDRAQVQMVDMGFHLPRPRLGVLQSQGQTVIPEPEPVHMRNHTGTSTDTSSSMIIFSPLPQRNPGGLGADEAGGLSSSGSFLILQK